MTVRELIEELTTLNQSAIVVVDGYEGGVDEISEVKSCRIAKNQNSKWYYGRHEITKDKRKNLHEAVYVI